MSQNNDLSTKSSSSTIGVPYQEENEALEAEVVNEMGEKGRIVITLAYTDQYNPEYGNPEYRCVPHDGEIARDTEGNIGIWVKNKVSKQFDFISVTKDLKDIVSQLSEMGVLKNAQAFATNSVINNMMFDNERGIVNLNPDKIYDRAIRYYAVRSSETNLNGEYEWMTGIMGRDDYGVEQLTTQFIDMMEDRREINGEVVIRSKPRTGNLIRDMVDGESYVVVFADANRKIFAQDVYQAISVTSQAGIIAPNTAIKGLVLETSRIGPEDNSTFLYVGESAANIVLRVFLRYADNSTYEITQEQISNGRLVIEDLDNINTEIPTDDTNLPFELVIKYYLLDDNSPKTEADDGSYISESANYISTTCKVYVKESITDNLVSIQPVGYITGEYSLPETKIQLKLFGLYQSGTRRDITSLTKTPDRISGFDNAAYNSHKNAWDGSNSLINTGSHDIIVKIPQGKTSALKSFSFNYETSTSHRRLIINGENSKFIKFNAYTGKMSFEETVSSSALAIMNSFSNANGSKIVPTHFTIRSAIDPDITYAVKIALENIKSFSYDTANGLLPFTDMPLLIEFCKIVEASEGVTSSVFVTNLALYYAKQSN